MKSVSTSIAALTFLVSTINQGGTTFVGNTDFDDDRIGTFIDESLKLTLDCGLVITAGVILYGSTYEHIHSKGSLCKYLVFGFENVPEKAEVFSSSGNQEYKLPEDLVCSTWWNHAGDTVILRIDHFEGYSEVVELQLRGEELIAITH